MESKKYNIRVDGCDASTEFEIELNALEFETVNRFVTLCNKASKYNCEPTIQIIN